MIMLMIINILVLSGLFVFIKVLKVGEDFVEFDWKVLFRDGGFKVKIYYIY